MQAHQNGIVYDFILNNSRQEQKVCIILDDYINEKDVKESIDKVCRIINPYNGRDANLKFNFEKQNQNLRIVISGRLDIVYDFLEEYQKLYQ